MSEYIAPTTAASEAGADFTVSTSTGVSCYGMSGAEMVGTVQVKNSDGTYSDLLSRINPSQAAVRVALSGIQSSFSITKKGTYRILKYATDGTVGIDIEAS